MPERIMLDDRPDFILLIEQFTKTNMTTLILNFEETHVIDSAGLGFLLIARQLINNAKKKLVLKNPKRHVKKVFDIINFEHIFKLECN